MKKWLAGKRFYSNEEVIAETNGRSLSSLLVLFYLLLLARAGMSHLDKGEGCGVWGCGGRVAEGSEATVV
uniref:Uncharacterized protein n=1 Tax=Rhodnius prolixus TaxID=13249 RepID=T1I2B1_RHOPR